MKKNMVLSVLMLSFSLLQGGWFEYLFVSPTQEVQTGLVEMATTNGRTQEAPDISGYIKDNRSYYACIRSISLTSLDHWYLFDGSQDAAQAIQRRSRGLLTWYYCESSCSSGEK